MQPGSDHFAANQWQYLLRLDFNLDWNLVVIGGRVALRFWENSFRFHAMGTSVSTSTAAAGIRGATQFA